MLHPRDVIILILIIICAICSVTLAIVGVSLWYLPMIFLGGICTTMVVVTWGEEFDEKMEQNVLK